VGVRILVRILVIAICQGGWLERQRGDDPCWRGICRDAIRLQPPAQKS
jgi:hypothetical protein